MYQVFLSYRHESGSEFGSFLSYLLTQLGYSVFFDAESLRAGPFEEKIDRAIDQCTFFLVLLAPGDLDRSIANPEKDWIVHEAQRAIERGKVIIPIRIKDGFSFPENCPEKTINALSKYNICDLSGADAASLVETLLVKKFFEDNPSKELAQAYNRGITDPAFLEWELKTLKGIYHDIPFVNVFGQEFPAYVVPGSEKVVYPFDLLTKGGVLHPIGEMLPYQESPWYNDFNKIVGPHIHFPNLYGFTSSGYVFDENGRIESICATPRTYKETAYTSNILHYELWRVYQEIGPQRIATLEDLPMRKAIHGNKSNKEVIFSGCNRSALNDVTIAVIDIIDWDNEYAIASAIRSEKVAIQPGYFGFVPSGGFELYELEENQNFSVIQKNYSVIGALYREYLEELFGDEDFSKPTGDDDLNRLRRHPKIHELGKGIKEGTYQFEFLGVDFDLTSLRQTLAFVLRIDDENFCMNNIKKNSENKSIQFQPLRDLEQDIQDNHISVMPETAATYALLKDHRLYREIVENDFKAIDVKSSK